MFEELIHNFDNGLRIEVGESVPALEYIRQAAEVAGMSKAVESLDAQGNPALVASAIEFTLEGLHLNRKLNKDRRAGRFAYRS
jgi:magnesium chelatase subunit I